MVSYYDKQDKIIRNVSVNSCLMLLVNCDGKVITTTEGIGGQGKPYHAVQERIAKTYGLQCGACTAGMVMTQYTSLQPNTFMQTLDYSLVEKNFDGNLCRCSCYVGIIKMAKSFYPEHQVKDANGNITGYNLSSKDLSQQSLTDKGISFYGVLKPGEKYMTQYGFVDNNRAFSNYDPSKDVNGNMYVDFLKNYSLKPALFTNDKVNYVRVLSMDDLISMLKIHGNHAEIVAGATSYGIPGYARPEGKLFIDINHIVDFHEYQDMSDKMVIGGNVQLNKAVKLLTSSSDKKLKRIGDHVFYIAGQHVRNLGSFIGGLVMSRLKGFASDVAPLLIASSAKLKLLHVYSSYHKIEENVEVLDYLNDNDYTKQTLIINVSIPKAKQNEFFGSFRVAMRQVNAHALINCAFDLVVDGSNMLTNDSRIVFGALTDKQPQMAINTVKLLKTVPMTLGNFNANFKVLIDAIDEIKFNTEHDYKSPYIPDAKDGYRKSLVQNLFFSGMVKFLNENILNQNKPSSGVLSAIEDWIHKVRQPNSDFEYLLEEQSPIKLYPVHFSFPKDGSINIASGEAIYTDDNPHMEGELYVGIATSTIAVGQVDWEGYNTKNSLAKAKAISGIVAVYTALDLVGNGFGFNGTEVLGNNGICYMNSPIAFVISETEELAQSVAKEIIFDYKNVQSFVNTIDDAITNKLIVPSVIAPTITKGDGGFELNNIKVDSNGNNLNYNNTGYITDSSGIKHVVSQFILSDKFMYGDVHHFYLEKQNANSYMDDKNRIVCYSATQMAGSVLRSICGALGVKPDKVIVKLRRVGGGFGGKLGLTPNVIAPIACSLASYKLRRPVRCIIPLQQDMIFNGGRGEGQANWLIGYNTDGKINTLFENYYVASSSLLGAGAGIKSGVPVIEGLAMRETLNGFILNINDRTINDFTALLPKPGRIPHRGFGHPEASILHSNIVDSVAGNLSKQLNKMVHYQDIELKNLNTSENNVYKQMFDIIMTDPKYRYQERMNAIQTFNQQNKFKKKGLVVSEHLYEANKGFGGTKDPLIKIMTNGNVHVYACIADIGQGANPKYLQVISQKLKVPIHKIVVEDYSSNVCEGGTEAGGSGGTELLNYCLIKMCDQLNTKLSKFYDTNLNIIDATGSIVKDSSGNPLNLSKDMLMFNEDAWNKLITNFVYTDAYGNKTCDGLTISSNNVGYDTSIIVIKYVSASEVEVNMLTGNIKLIETNVVYDIGSAINPAIDMGQLEGGFIYSCGFMLHEERLYDNNAKLLIDDTWEYKPPAIINVPEKFICQFLRNNSDNISTNPADPTYVPFSSKQSQEMGASLAGSAYGAIKAAIRSFRMENGLSPVFRLDTPATAHRIQQASGLTKDMLKA